MKELNNKEVIFEKELEEMISYINETWSGSRESIREIIKAGFKDGYSIKEKSISNSHDIDFIEKWMKSRKVFIEELTGSEGFFLFDDIFNIPRNILLNSLYYNDKLFKDFNFEKQTKTLFKKIDQNLIDKKMLPIGWDDVKKSGLSAFSYFKNFSLGSEKLFDGHNSSSAVAGGFEHRTNLASIYYEKTEQSQSPILGLYSAAFAHGMIIREHNNSVELFYELKKLKEVYNNKKYNYITYLDLLNISKNEILTSLMKSELNVSLKCSSQEELNSFIEELKEKKQKKCKP